ncbi:MAG: Aspartate aminotransferase, partial [uncultured Phycisphaerae bacterium]
EHDTLQDRRLPPHPAAAAVPVRPHQQDEVREAGGRGRHHRPRHGQPDRPDAGERGREAGRGGHRPAEPPVLGQQRHRRHPQGGRQEVQAEVRRRPRPRDRGDRHHRVQGGVQPPVFGHARAGRHDRRRRPGVPDPHLRPGHGRRERDPGPARERPGVPRPDRAGVRRDLPQAQAADPELPAQPDEHHDRAVVLGQGDRAVPPARGDDHLRLRVRGDQLRRVQGPELFGGRRGEGDRRRV